MANVSFRFLTLIIMLAGASVALADLPGGNLPLQTSRPGQHRTSLRMANAELMDFSENPEPVFGQTYTVVNEQAYSDEPVPDAISSEPVLTETITTPTAVEELVPQPISSDPSDWDEDYWDNWHQEPPAPTSDSGTWFNRGTWYFRQDFVYMSRYSTDTNMLVADYIDFYPNTAIPTERRTTGRSQGFEPGGRTTLGRFLFRDQKNRDHSVEFVFFGLFDWQQGGGMVSRDDDRLFTLVDPFRTFTGIQVGAFNAAKSQSFVYDSAYDSYELNYVLAQRLGRDRLELTPEGEWVRKLTPGSVSTLSAGVRYMSIEEGFDWHSFADDPTEAHGRYQVTTTNQMLGLQFGHELVIQRPRFRFGVRNRVGSFINYADQSSFVNIVDSRTTTQGGQQVPLTSGDQLRAETGHAHDMAFMYDLSIMAAYHIRPNIAVRTGYEFMFINQVALAPDQLTFTPSEAPRLVNGGALLYNGFSLGLEMVW